MTSADTAAPAPRSRPSKTNRLQLLREVMNAMAAYTAPQPATLPSGPGVVDEFVSTLAVDSANSAVAIAQAVANLGMDATADGNSPLDKQRAEVIWTETLAQMSRIQRLYKLPELPFQSSPTPVPPALP